MLAFHQLTTAAAGSLAAIYLIAQEEITSINEWGKHGILGLVIFALFALVFFLGKWMLAHADKQVDHIGEQSVRHADERKEWRDAQDHLVARVETALDRQASSADKHAQSLAELIAIMRKEH